MWEIGHKALEGLTEQKGDRKVDCRKERRKGRYLLQVPGQKGCCSGLEWLRGCHSEALKSAHLRPTTMATVSNSCCFLSPTFSYPAGASHWQKSTGGKGIWKTQQ